MTSPHASDLNPRIAQELGLRPAQVMAVADLLSGGATVPFIARYRKEATGSLDEVAIAAIQAGLARLRELEQRRTTIQASLAEQGVSVPALLTAVAKAGTLSELEDLYLPYRPKRRTRAGQARERGLAPVAEAILAGGRRPDLSSFGEDAEAGARDIVAEIVSEDAATRGELRRLFQERGVVLAHVARGKREDPGAAKFRDYFDWHEDLARCPSHRVLAMLRGDEAGMLSVSVRPDEAQAVAILRRRWLRPDRHQGWARDQLDAALVDAYDRLLGPSLGSEALSHAKERADGEAIAVFARNLRELLLAAPFGRQAVLAIDPGLRTGGKTVALGGRGELLATTTIFPHEPKRQDEAASTVRTLVQRHAARAVAIGDGTAGRETQAFVESLDLGIPVVLVPETGASIYSAGESARREFPDLDLTVRGAISIGRRLQDPLSELVKLDAKTIGVGQYQHDVDQSRLRDALQAEAERCVNAVGVELDTASEELLTHVAGLGPALARAILAYRGEHGGFRCRRDLLSVPRLGAKTFEQCAGFLRLRHSDEPLDASAVHPERYGVVRRMATDLGVPVASLIGNEAALQRIDLRRYIGDGLGEPTLRDILAELAKPGRDPRAPFTAVRFADVHGLDDLAEGMLLPGIVTNVTAFGAFVDLGVKQDGLVHVSQLADHFVTDPAEILSVRQAVRVRVLSVDRERKRIALSLKGVPQTA